MAGDGAEHSIIRPDSTHPPTAGDLLERIVTRDDTAHSATTTAAALTDPATNLGLKGHRPLLAQHHFASSDTTANSCPGIVLGQARNVSPPAN